MPVPSKSLFSKIGDAKMSLSANYMRHLPDGGTARFDLKVKRLYVDVTRKGVDFFTGEFEVMGSNHPEFKVGTTVNFYTDTTSDFFLSNVKALVAPVIANMLSEPVSEEMVDEDTMAAVVGVTKGADGKDVPPGYYCAGALVRAEAIRVTSKKTAKDVTRLNWFQV